MVRLIQNLVVEDGIIQSEAKPDRVSALEFFGDLRSLLVAILRRVNNGLFGVAGLILAQIAVIITLHFVVENNVLGVVSTDDEMLVDQVEDIVAVVGELLFNLELVVADGRKVFVSL